MSDVVIAQEQLAKLTEIIEQSMAAAGMDRDADPMLLPGRIEELRFCSCFYVSAEYPRREVGSRKAEVEERARKIGAALNGRRRIGRPRGTGRPIGAVTGRALKAVAAAI